jgi:hypothetical protein
VSTSSFTPDELRAAAEVNQELGPDYRDAVLESFLDKVGREIDARVDARLNGPPAPRPYPPQQQYQPQQQYPLQPAQQHATPPPAPGEGHHRDNRPFILAIVTTALGIPLTAIVASLNQGSAGAEFAMLLVIWAAIAIINVVFNRHRD